MGTTGVTAQAVGRDNREDMILVGLRNGLIALCLGGLILLLRSPLASVWFNQLMSSTATVQASGIDYFEARIWGAPAVLLNFVLIGWLLGREQSGIVLIVSIVGNAANVLLDYVLIVQQGLASSGAGIAQTLSQYLVLIIGIAWASREVTWGEIRTATQRFWEINAFKAVFTLNGNLFIRSFCNMSVFTIFFSLSSRMGTETLAENALLIQVLLTAIYCFDGIGFATETIVGGYEGKAQREKLIPTLNLAITTSLLIALSSASAFVLFPHTLFGLLTDHNDLIDIIKIHVPWLFLLMGSCSVTAILDAYFGGLARGEALRNSSITGIISFIPVAWISQYFHSNHVLLMAIGVSIIFKGGILVAQLLLSLPEANSKDHRVSQEEHKSSNHDSAQTKSASSETGEIGA